MQTDEFEWDDAKARLNVANHGVTFEDATFVFDGFRAIDDIEDTLHYEEERWSIMGEAEQWLLVVIFTHRGQTKRIISARKAE